VGGEIELALEWPDGGAVLHVIHHGEAQPDRSADPLTEHGRGLWLVQRLGAQLALEALPGYGTHLRAALPIRSRTRVR
jgi:hypothetical protein